MMGWLVTSIAVGFVIVSSASALSAGIDCEFDVDGFDQSVKISLVKNGGNTAPATNDNALKWLQDGREIDQVALLTWCDHCLVGASVHLKDGSVATITWFSPYAINESFSKIRKEDGKYIAATYSRQGLKMIGEYWETFVNVGRGWCGGRAAR